ncbi:acetyl-CoA synthetase-like protein [Trametes polyzona]|nr:acetyl-CoA synthetase-like protein [Trametes polyzona]
MTVTISRPTPQGVNHPTFHPPPFDHGLSIPGLYEYHAKHSPEHPVFSHADPATGALRDITFAEAWSSIRAVADVVSARLSRRPGLEDTPSCDGAHCTDGRTVVGVLALSDAVSYVYILVALMGLGYTAFPLSTTDNAEAVAHLLEVEGVTRLFVSEDAEMQAVALEAKELLNEKGIVLELLPMVVPEEYASATPHDERWKEFGRVVDDEPALILHSTGSTGFPKPITMTGRALVNAANVACYGEIDLAGKRIAAHTNPLFHATGICTLTYPLSCGLVFCVFPPVRPPVVPTPANYLSAWQACKCDIMFCVPVFIEGLARNSDGVEALKALDYVMFAGAPMAKSIGNMLVSEGVHLVSVWGSTEVGVATKILPCSPMPKDSWEYVEFSPHIKFYMKPQEGFDSVFEPIHVTTDTSFPHVVNTEVDGQPAWAMGDMLERHPTEPGWWKILGRMDDQIVLSTGGMVSIIDRARFPTVYWSRASRHAESMLTEEPTIRSAIVFGHGHIEPGILIEPAAEQRGEDLRKTMRPALDRVNASLERQSQIRPHMILFTSRGKPLLRTVKDTVRRGVCIKLYAEEIEALYMAESDESPENRAFRGRM